MPDIQPLPDPVPDEREGRSLKRLNKVDTDLPDWEHSWERAYSLAMPSWADLVALLTGARP